MNCLNNMDRIQIVNQLMMQLFDLYEQKGKAFYYKDVFQSDDITMVRQTLESDVMGIGEFLELDITPTRLRLLADQKRQYVPKNKDETLLLNIKEALEKIQEENDDFHLSVHETNDLVSILFRNHDRVTYRIKGAHRDKITIPFYRLPSDQQLTKLIQKYNEIKRSKKYELITIISNFYVDFIQIRPYTEHNELIALILIYTIIAREFHVCRYDSFFSILNRFKDRFSNSLIQAFYDWENGLSQTDSIVKVFVDTLDIMHKNVELLERNYKFETKLNKTDSIEAIIMSGPAVFTKNDIREQAPLASDSTINRTLQLLRNSGVIQSLGQGRSAKWQRLASKNEKFTVESLNLFSE